MEQRDTRRALERLVQQGVVMGVDTGRRTARVKFPATGITSGWLHVLQHPGAGVGVEPAEGHSHKASLGLWMPKVNDKVLVLYLPVEDGDGYILGVV